MNIYAFFFFFFLLSYPLNIIADILAGLPPPPPPSAERILPACKIELKMQYFVTEAEDDFEKEEDPSQVRRER